MDDAKLLERIETFIDDVGVRVDKFCEKAGIGKSTYYRWKNGKVEISDRIKNNLDAYLKKFGY